MHTKSKSDHSVHPVQPLHSLSKKRKMNRKKTFYRDNGDSAEEIQAGQPSASPQATQEKTVIQLTPDDVLSAEGPIPPAAEDGTPSREALEQDVVAVNPSLDSMESRG